MTKEEQAQREEYKIRRAEDARQVLENPAYKEAFMMVRAALVDKISATKTLKSDELVDAVQQLQNLDRLEKAIKGFYESGKVVISKRSKLGKLNNLL